MSGAVLKGVIRDNPKGKDALCDQVNLGICIGI
jgi:hypothetical protein